MVLIPVILIHIPTNLNLWTALFGPHRGSSTVILNKSIQVAYSSTLCDYAGTSNVLFRKFRKLHTLFLFPTPLTHDLHAPRSLSRTWERNGLPNASCPDAHKGLCATCGSRDSQNARVRSAVPTTRQGIPRDPFPMTIKIPPLSSYSTDLRHGLSCSPADAPN